MAGPHKPSESLSESWKPSAGSPWQFPAHLMLPLVALA
jgi:hypothetical protein